MVGAIHFLILPLVSLARQEQSPVHLCLGPAKSTQADVDFFSSRFTGGRKASCGKREWILEEAK